MEQMPPINVRVDYQKCKPEKCNRDGICQAAAAFPVKALQQEQNKGFPFLHPSKYCKGCAICVEKCPLKAVEKVRP